MRKRILSLSLALLLCIGCFSGCKFVKKEVGSGTAVEVGNASEAITYLSEVGEDYGYSNALSELTEKSTTTVDGDTYYRLQQNYQGVPVYGKAAVLAVDENGVQLSLSGSVTDIDSSISMTANITSEQAIQQVGEYLSTVADYTGSDSLDATASPCIYITDDEEAKLAYCVYMGCYEVLVSMADGTVLFSRATVREEAATGYVASDKAREHGFTIDKQSEDCYVLGNIEAGLIVFDLQKTNSDNFRPNTNYVTSPDNIFGNTPEENGYETGAELLINATRMAEWYQNQLGFRTPSNLTMLCYNDSFDLGKNVRGGAFTEDGVGVLFIGHKTGVNDIDVLAHEYGHVITTLVADFSLNSTENRAINEGFSDIVGELTEAWFFGQSAPDWVMSQEKGHKIKRNLADPKKTTNAETCTDKLPWRTNADYFYSTVISHAGYLMWNGIDGNSSKKIPETELLKLWYRAALMMPSDCDFQECRELVKLAAISMKLSDAQKNCIGEAFDAVGVQDGQTVDYELDSDATLSVYGSDSTLCSDYKMTIVGKQFALKDGVALPENIRETNLTLLTEYRRYYESRHITEQGPIALNLKAGTYTIELTAGDGSGTSCSFTLAIGAYEDKDKLEIFTDFGSKGEDGMYAAYYSLCMDREASYGKGKVNQGYLEGLSVVRLLDFNADGTEELFFAYLYDVNTAQNNDCKGRYEIWTWENNALKQVYDSDKFYRASQDTTRERYLRYCIKEGRAYLWTEEYSTSQQGVFHWKSELLTLQGEQFEAALTLEFDYDNTYEMIQYVNGQQVTEEEYEANYPTAATYEIHLLQMYLNWDYEQPQGEILRETERVLQTLLGEENTETETLLVQDAISKDLSYKEDMFNEATGRSEATEQSISFHIPKINLSGAEIDSVNTEIRNIFSALPDTVATEIEEYGYPQTSEGVSYSWIVNGDVLSLVIMNEAYPIYSASTEYYVYNLSVSKKAPVTKDEVLLTAGTTLADYNTKAEQALGSSYRTHNAQMVNEKVASMEFYNEQLLNTISQTNIDEALPFFNENRQLCIAGREYSLVEGESYWHIYNLEDFVLVPDYAEMQGVLPPAAAAEASITAQYEWVLLQHPKDKNTAESSYVLYDVDKNNVPELIVKEDMTYYFYTFDGTKAVFCGDFLFTYDDCLYQFSGNGLVVYDGGNGYLHSEYITLFKLQNNTLEWSETLAEFVAPSPDELNRVLDNYTPIRDFHPISEPSYLP